MSKTVLKFMKAEKTNCCSPLCQSQSYCLHLRYTHNPSGYQQQHCLLEMIDNGQQRTYTNLRIFLIALLCSPLFWTCVMRPSSRHPICLGACVLRPSSSRPICLGACVMRPSSSHPICLGCLLRDQHQSGGKIWSLRAAQLTVTI